MRYLSREGPIWIEPASSEGRSTLARHLNAVRRYLETGDARKLRAMEGLVIETREGRVLPLLTDVGVIDHLAEGGEIHFEVYRR